MFNATTDARPGLPPAIDRLFFQGLNPLQVPVDLDLCRERVPQARDCPGTRFAGEAAKLSARNAFRPSFTAEEWRTLASFCITRRLPPDYRVAVRGRSDRALRFVLEGSLWQVAADGARAPRLVLPGTILGEDALFSDEPGELDIRTLEDAVILELPLTRQKELTARFPAIAFELLRAAGAVIAARGRTGAAHEELATN